MASGVGGLPADGPPCARPSGLLLPRAFWVSALILRSFVVCKGGSDLVGGPVHMWLAVEMLRDGGRVGQRLASRPSWAFLVGKGTGGRRLDKAISTSKRAFSARTCEQAGRRIGRHATGYSSNIASSRLAPRPAKPNGRQAVWRAVRLVGWQPVFHADRQTCKQATRPKCRLPSLSFWTGGVPGRGSKADLWKFFKKDEYLGRTGATTGIRHLTFSQPYA